MSLKDKQIVVTRAPHQAVILVDELRTRGATPIIYPCIDIAPPVDVNKLDSALRNISAYDWLILTSVNTVLALRRRIQAMRISVDFAHLKIAVIGESTAQALEDIIGFTATIIPDDHSGAGLVAALDLTEDDSVLLPQSSIAPPDLYEALVASGAQVNSVAAYQTITGHGGENVPALLDEGRVDALTFTSGSTITGFLERVAPRTPLTIPAACIGETTAAVAREHGFETVLVAADTTLEKMLASLWDYFDTQ